jgi:hypothetical protein
MIDMNNKIKMIIGISLPILVLVISVVSIVISNSGSGTKHDFIYTLNANCSNGPYAFNSCYIPSSQQWSSYSVVNGTLQKKSETDFNKIASQFPEYKYTIVYPKLYKYNSKSATFESISFEDAQKLNLTDGGSSPDGYNTVPYNNYNYDFNIFSLLTPSSNGYSNQGTVIIENKGSAKKIRVSNEYIYMENFRLIGWIK